MCSKEEESSKKISEGQSNAPTVAEQVEIKFVPAELNLLHQNKCELSKWFYLSSMNIGTASAIVVTLLFTRRYFKEIINTKDKQDSGLGALSLNH